MRGQRIFLAALGCTAILLTSCLAGGTATQKQDTLKIDKTPVTLTVWSFFVDPEQAQFQKALDSFHAAYPWITVKHVGGKANNDIQRAINSGTPPDVALEAGPDDSAKYCSSGAWIDLKNYLQQENIDLSSRIPESALRYTAYKGKQCALPMLSDAYGLYYNLDMFQQAGISKPPKTLSELSSDAKKLTQFNPDGSIKVAGFVPLQEFYETSQLDNGIWSGTRWYDSSGKSALGSDKEWQKLLEWQKSLIDWYGYDKLQKFFAQMGGSNSEFSSSNGFETHKVAMLLDGEWRPTFIKNDNAQVNYATAPFPVADDRPNLYGAGQIGGTIIGVPRGTAHQVDAYLLVKYLALNAPAEEQMAEGLFNVPTVKAALNDPKLTGDSHFSIFLKIFANPHSAYKTVTPLGTGDADLLTPFIDKYESGGVPDLGSGLQNVASQIDHQSQL